MLAVRNVITRATHLPGQFKYFSMSHEQLGRTFPLSRNICRGRHVHVKLTPQETYKLFLGNYTRKGTI